MTARARLMGLRVRVTPATAPALRVAPSMIDASSSLRPSAVNTAPRPGVEQRIVLEHANRRFDRIETRAAASQHLPAGFERGVERGAIRGLLRGVSDRRARSRPRRRESPASTCASRGRRLPARGVSAAALSAASEGASNSPLTMFTFSANDGRVTANVFMSMRAFRADADDGHVAKIEASPSRPHPARASAAPARRSRGRWNTRGPCHWPRCTARPSRRCRCR